MGKKSEIWTDEVIEELKKVWGTQSLSKLSIHFSEKFGITASRNAICGKAHRMGLGSTQSIKKEKISKQPIKKIEKIDAKISLADVQNGQCRYSHESGASMKVCGRRTYRNYNYCEGCCKIVYRNFDQLKS